LTEPK
jgi:6-phosphogluconolactonase